MTDEEIRDVFVELRRIDVDLEQPPGLAIGTGFRTGELAPWLRSLPDNLGHELFAEKLREYVSNAAPNDVPVDGTRHEHRLCPTLEQLHAGIEVLINEWDPIGARLGALARHDVSIHAYNALGGILRVRDHRLAERHIAEMFEQIETEVFGVRPSPIEQRRYLARRLIQVVVDHPGEEHEENPFIPEREHSRTEHRPIGGVYAKVRARRHVVPIGPRGDELPPLDPNGTCTECGSVGTIAVVQRDAEPFTSRYCLTCWPSVRDQYSFSLATSNADGEQPEVMIKLFDAAVRARREQVRYTASALWDDRLILFRQMMASSNGEESSEIRERNLRWMADMVVTMEPTMYGPMPADIREFVAKHKTPDA
jgi:hypothetical protein